MTQRSDGEGTVTIPPGATVTGVRTKVDRTTTHDETFVYLRTVVAAEPGDVITLVFPHAPGPHPEEPLIAVPVTVPSPPPDTHTVELGAACGEQDVAHNLWLFFRASCAPGGSLSPRSVYAAAYDRTARDEENLLATMRLDAVTPDDSGVTLPGPWQVPPASFPLALHGVAWQRVRIERAELVDGQPAFALHSDVVSVSDASDFTAELPTPSGFVVGAVTTTGQGFEAGAPFTTRLLNVPVNPVTSLDVDLSVAMLGQPANPTIHGNQLWLPRIDGVGRV